MKTIFFLLFLVLTVTAHGQTGEIHGALKKKRGRPLTGATIILRRERTAIDTTFTDSAGTFHFRDVPVGLCEVECRATGYIPHLVTDIPVVAEIPRHVEIRPVKVRRKPRIR